MSTTLQSVLQDIASYINQDPAVPAGTDLTSWTSLVDQSQREWAATIQYRILRVPNYPLAFTTSGASIGLPNEFQSLMSPVADVSTPTPARYYEIKPEERFLRASTDQYIYTVQDNSNGNYLIINPVPLSTASLMVDLHVNPTSLATLTDVVTCDPQFLVLRTISKILSARSDPRFPQVKADSDDYLGHMMDDETAQSQSYSSGTSDSFTKRGFRVGA